MRSVLLMLSLALTCLAGGAAQAGWSDFWHRARVDRHRVNSWPAPFQYADRDFVTAPFATMMDRGWRLQNTISDHFFDPETQQLTHAGQLKIRWIATQAPVHRRAVYVLRGATPQVTAARFEAVQEAVLTIAPDTPPEVMFTDVAPPGSSDYFDQISRQVRESNDLRLPPRKEGISD